MGTQMRICEECVCCAAAAEVCELHGFPLVSALPLLKLMSQLHAALHELVEGVSGNNAFRQSICCHIACQSRKYAEECVCPEFHEDIGHGRVETFLMAA